MNEIFTDERREALRHNGTKSQAQVVEMRVMARELCEALKLKPGRSFKWVELPGSTGDMPAIADHKTGLYEIMPKGEARTCLPRLKAVICHMYSDGIPHAERHAQAAADAAAEGLAYHPLPWSWYDPDRCIAGLFVAIPRTK